ncbi:MAG: GEVED domain-containing protein, partial [Balneolaceae bacterium]
MRLNYIKFFGFVSMLFTFYAFGQGAFNVPEVLYYKFDQTGTTVQNHANPGTSTAGTIFGNLSQSGVGQFGSALVGTGGPGTSNGITTGWSTNLTGDWTMSFWINMAQPSGTRYVFGDLSAGSFRCFAGGVAPANGMVVRGTGWTDLQINNILGSGTGYSGHVVHIVYTAATGVSQVYVDGVLNNTVNQTPNLTISGTGFGVGNYTGSGSDCLDGRMDEFRLYNRALSITEIGSTYNQILPLNLVCGVITNAGFSNAQGATVDFSWDHGTGNDNYEFEYGLVGFTPGIGAGTSVSAAITGASTTQTLTGLVTGSSYHVYVTETCNTGLDQYVLGPLTFMNDYCGVSTTYSEYLSSIVSTGAVSNISYSATSQPAGSYANETAQLFESYETQTFNISTNYSAGANGVNIWVDWDNDLSFDATDLVASVSGSAAANTLTVSVPVGTPQGNYRMRVRGQWGSTVSPPPCGNVNYGSTVDFTLSIVSPPTCLQPSALNASNITSTSADLGWTENNNATTWNIEWGVAGFALGTGTPANGVTSNPYPIVITPNTDYSFYVQSDCGGGDISSWAGPFTFSNAYCAPTYSYSSEYLSVIETVGGIMDVSHTSASYPAGGYVDETAQILQVYETLTFDLNTVYTPTYGHVVRVWVDWNNDFNFDHSTEMVSTITGTGGLLTQQITVPAGTPVGTYRVRVRGVYGTGANPMPCSNESWGSAADFTLDVIAPPSCLPPMNISATNITTTSMELSWTELNAATSWNIEYGPSGYTQGSAAGIPVLANSNPFTVTGLSPSANYDFYVQSICSASDQSAWRGPYSQYTACGIAIAPFYEGFNSGVQPQCWDNLSSNPSTSVDNFWNFNKQGEYGALNNGKTIGTFVSSDGSTPNPDSMMLITPEIDISPLTTPYLSFEWFSNNTDNPGDNVPLIVEIFDGTTWHLLDTLIGDDPEWQFVNYNLSAFSNSIIKVRFMTNQSVPNTAFYNDILLDEVRIDDCISLGGQDGSFDICRMDNTVNLEDNIIVKPNGGGIWSFPGQPAYLVDDTLFNVQYLPAGSYEVYYVERFVCYDTTVATINVFGPSSAGIDGADTVCKNEPIDLFAALGGNLDLGGVWYDFSNTALPNSQPKAQPIPGNYNYIYIVSNGVCP